MKRAFLAFSVLLAANAAHGQSFQLDFGDAASPPAACSSNADGSGPLIACSSNVYLNQAHGDVAGVIDVTYFTVPGPETGIESMVWGGSTLGLPFGAAVLQGGPNHSRIELKPLNGGSVTLTHFDLAGSVFFGGSTAHTAVYEINGITPLQDFGILGFGPPMSFDDLGISSSAGLWIEGQWIGGLVGIANIDFTVTVIPEPQTYALLLAGLGLLGFAARRKAKSGTDHV